MIPHILWTFWFGGNITNDFAHGSRSNNLERLIAGLESKIDHRHITSENLHLINVPNHPIHPQIFLPYLSGIHKSDYMRNYVMYHYGGAYADIKENTMLTWSPYFEDVLPNTWVYGQQEITTIDIACHPQTLKVQLGILMLRAPPFGPATNSWSQTALSFAGGQPHLKNHCGCKRQAFGYCGIPAETSPSAVVKVLLLARQWVSAAVGRIARRKISSIKRKI